MKQNCLQSKLILIQIRTLLVNYQALYSFHIGNLSEITRFRNSTLIYRVTFLPRVNALYESWSHKSEDRKIGEATSTSRGCFTVIYSMFVYVLLTI